MTDEAPYANPETSAGSDASGQILPDLLSGTPRLTKWVVLAGLNGSLPAMAGLAIAQGRLGTTPFLLICPQMLIGAGIVTFGLFRLDEVAFREGGPALSRALSCGAIAKAILQIVPVAEFLIGWFVIDLVNQLPGRGGIVSVLIATLIYGACLAGIAIAIGLFFAMSEPIPSPPRAGR